MQTWPGAHNWRGSSFPLVTQNLKLENLMTHTYNLIEAKSSMQATKTDKENENKQIVL